MPEVGLAGTKNGELLSVAEAQGFDLFLTIDQGIAYQQNLSGRALAVLVLHPKTSRLDDLLPMVAECLTQLQTIHRGELRIIRA